MAVIVNSLYKTPKNLVKETALTMGKNRQLHTQKSCFEGILPSLNVFCCCECCCDIPQCCDGGRSPWHWGFSCLPPTEWVWGRLCPGEWIHPEHYESLIPFTPSAKPCSQSFSPTKGEGTFLSLPMSNFLGCSTSMDQPMLIFRRQNISQFWWV